ncbi:uncharacterized protein LOC117737629 isoform X1 [Cyclopterus lumpus]|uniref:uncharacterized protein LOC117737629 isoform X1 n=2 Tax=Cyclopterus lumpus TaxID=8103 RepID=UPI001486591D|nr:uncharacterized protein LOC117737629 isoform X1 [Cyclopterus lumpus]XP_034399594.1 uncharacterized protein LOC117737629 isoform X1 [Cyclopterus lumpus]XP_034399595.1 uncharacterized protein LOC117737629 isoform X1 [Cyclopterus lumpus]
MSSRVLLTVLFALPLALGWVVPGEREEAQMVCAGREFRLPVYSTSRTVTFTPNPEGPRRILLDKTIVKDRRFEWTRDKMLVLREVTHSDQGLYAIKLFSGFTYEAVRLTVSECIKSYHRNYGDKFEHNIPENGSLLEFSPRGAPPEAMPVVLWNRTDPMTSNAGRGRLLRGGKVWVAERVTQADQGNYTVRDSQGKVLSRNTLTVRGHSFNVTRFTKESLNLPLFLPVPHAHLIFTPTRYPDESSLGPFDPKPPRGPVQLIREGHITDHDMRYRGLISLGRSGSINEVIIVRLTSRHDGVYEIRDVVGNLVSSTWLQVIEKGGRWRAFLKSITVPAGMFVSLIGFILFMKRYPNCSLSQIIAGLRANRTPPANPPRVNIQDYSQSSPQPSGYYSHSQLPATPRKCTPRASPTHPGYGPVVIETQRVENQEAHGLAATSSPCPSSTTERDTSHHNEEERRISFSVPGASDCLHSSEDCVQFQIKKDGDKGRTSTSQGYFSTLPLDRDTSESCSVYTSEKLNFL